MTEQSLCQPAQLLSTSHNNNEWRGSPVKGGRSCHQYTLSDQHHCFLSYSSNTTSNAGAMLRRVMSQEQSLACSAEALPSLIFPSLDFTNYVDVNSKTSPDKCRSKAGWRLTSQGAHDGQLALQGSSAQGNAPSNQHRLIRELLSACCTVLPQLSHRLIHVHDVNVASLGVPR